MKNLLSRNGKFSVPAALFAAGILTVFGGLLIWKTFAAGTLLTVSPSAQTVKPGDQFTVAVHVNSGSTPINAVGISLNYDSNKVDFVSASNAGTPFDINPKKVAIGGVVTIEEAVFGNGSAAPVTGDQLASTITFVAKAGISGSMSLSFAATSQVYQPNGTNLVTDIVNQSTGGTITFQAPANPPTVTLTVPAATFTAPANINLAPNITVDPSRTISKVEFFNNGTTPIGTRTVAPWDFTWTSVPAGTYSLTAKVTDSAGGTDVSNAVSVNVGQTPSAPTVGLSVNDASPTAPATVVLTATATPFTGRNIAKVEFFNGNTSLGTKTAAPYALTLSNVAAGNYSYHAVATDNATPALVGQSTNVAVVVGNPPPQAPAAPNNLRVSPNSLTATSVTLDWDDNINPSGTTYIVSRNGVDLPTVITATMFSDNGLSPTTTYSYTVKAVSATNGLKSTATTALPVTTPQLPPVAGDINGDRKVDTADFGILFAKWGTADGAADLNKDGEVSGFDFVILFKNFGRSG